MNVGKSVWLIYDIKWKCIADSSENGLPLIFDNELDAKDVASERKTWIVVQADIVPRGIEECLGEKIITTNLLCFECGERPGIECAGRKLNEPTRCQICLYRFLKMDNNADTLK